MSSEFDFSGLAIRQEPVIGPDGKHYTLEEATGKAATDHRNDIMASSTFGPDGRVTGVRNLASVEAKFVAACLWDEKRRNPSVTLVQSWPARVQKALYAKAQELSSMDEESPVYTALKSAMALDGSPITFEVFCDWVSSLNDQEFRPLTRLFAKAKEPPKNS